ncbi:cysteine desulfurase family protein [Isoptericola sp. b441]|uniref:Cysteine desulfurase family protein n=1 Tax=Actinotalea lenta TaxID=3064654 RepID=A0ABT9DBI7_9CELL|nr:MULTISPECIES: cysteine desulfurase family protein [unclassified Isoptericola]MDO8108245.1 cysteine desulfurase family protein [Isoptericola sp. b441]MDO8120082.1 cysteine desulfurase family protein [Isoptericola sp. b490]
MTRYLDHAATTPIHPQVAEAMAARLGVVGNPSSVHAAGREARRVVEESRERLAAAVGAHPTEVVWTSGGTEADNLAIKGLWWARHAADPRRTRVLVSAVEHHAVLDPARWLASQGAEVVELPVHDDGRLDLAALDAELAAHGDRVAVVSVMWANNEIGTIQPVADVVARAHAWGVPVHTDAVQAVGHLPVDLAAVRADAVSLTAHKLGGPVGVGALVVRRGLDLVPVLHGGGQERSVRSGTLDVVGVAGFALAAELAVSDLPAQTARLAGLRDALLAGVRDLVPDAVLRGPDPASGLRVPHNLHLTFPGCEGDSLIYLMDSHGVACSTGSACTAGVAQPSHVLLACGVEEVDARGALRFSFGRTSTPGDVEAVLAALPDVVTRARAAGMA